MSNEKSSQVHNENPGWDATNPLQVGMEMWARFTTEQLARVASLWDELVEIESEGYKRVRRSGKEMADMMEKTITYMSSMTAQMQTMTLEAARKSQEFMTR